MTLEIVPSSMVCTKANRNCGGALFRAAERGWRLLPVEFRGKKPLLRNWPERASSDLGQLEAWSREYPQCNWGLATGKPSGVFVVDVDGEAGLASAAILQRQGLKLPSTLTVATGRAGGGLHRYYRMPIGFDIRNDGSCRIGPHIDIRGTGGYVVFPPSTHTSGKIYRFIEPNKAIAEQANWLIERLRATNSFTKSPEKLGIRILTEGERNDGMTRYAGALRRRGASREELELALIEANAKRCIPQLALRKILKIAESVARYPVGGPDPLEQA